MRLVLEDGPKRNWVNKLQKGRGRGPLNRRKGGRERTFYNPATGMATVVRSPLQDDDNAEFGLAGPFKQLKNKVKAKREFRQKKKSIKREGKLQKLQYKTDAKTQVQKNKLNRRVAKGDAQVAKQRAKQAEYEAKQEEANAAMDPTYDEQESDYFPEESYNVPGGESMVNPSEYGGDDETIDVDAEPVYEEELSSGGEFNVNNLLSKLLKNTNAGTVITTAKASIDTVSRDINQVKNDVRIIRKAIDPEGELSAGWIDGAIQLVKGAAGGVANVIAPGSKTANALLKIKDSKAGQTVNKLINSKTGQVVKSGLDATKLKAQNELLLERNKNLTTQRNVLIATNVASGTLAVYGLVRKTRR